MLDWKEIRVTGQFEVPYCSIYYALAGSQNCAWVSKLMSSLDVRRLACGKDEVVCD
jgi:hypothetical protein